MPDGGACWAPVCHNAKGQRSSRGSRGDPAPPAVLPRRPWPPTSLSAQSWRAPPPRRKPCKDSYGVRLGSFLSLDNSCMLPQSSCPASSGGHTLWLAELTSKTGLATSVMRLSRRPERNSYLLKRKYGHAHSNTLRVAKKGPDPLLFD